MDPIFLDLLAGAVLLIALWKGHQRGFVLTLCSMLAVFVALIGAAVVTNFLAAPVSEALLPMISDHVHALAKEAMGHGETPEALSAILAGLQDSALYRWFIGAVEEAVRAGAIAATSSLAHAVASYLALQLSRIVLFLISFVLILCLWHLLSRALDLAFRLPVLSTLNKWSGAAVGLVQGALLVYIAVWLTRDNLLNDALVSQTHLLKFFWTTTPLSLLGAVLQPK